jgi:hypothetical protein
MVFPFGGEPKPGKGGFANRQIGSATVAPQSR